MTKLIDVLEAEHSVELDGQFCKTINLYPDSKGDDVYLELEESQFSYDQVLNATFDSESGCFTIEDDDGNSYELELFDVVPVIQSTK